MRAPPRHVPITLFLALLATAGCNRARDIPADTPKPRLYHRVVTLCIGINDYASPKMKDLSFAEPDATALAERLRTRYGYETVLLLGKDATRAAIGMKLREYKEQLGEKDVLIVYFAGHGQVLELPSHGRAGFLVPQDADLDLDDRSNVDAWAAEALEMRQLVDMLRAMPTHHVLLIADACCSGFMTQRGAFQERKDLHLLLSEPSRVVLAATTERQQAGEDGKTGHGYFTGALLEQLARQDAASVTDLFVEIRKQVSHDAKEMLPQMAKVGDGDGEFVFIPLEVPEHDIQLALRGGLEHALKGVYERALRRVAQRTRLEDVLDVFNAVDYRFSTQPRQREKVWQEKFARFQENAQIDDVLAMAALYYCYAKGLGTAKDPQKAHHWAVLAQDSGQAAGTHVLGDCYVKGIGVNRNQTAGAALTREAARQDFPLSFVALAQALLEENPTPEQVKEAIRWLEKAENAGLPRTTVRLVLARHYLGFQEGAVNQGLHVGEDIDQGLVLEMLQPEAGQHPPEAQFLLYLVYAHGLIQEPAIDAAHATTWLTESAAAGYAPAQFGLAFERYRRFGAPALSLEQDLTAARTWAELAAGQHYPPAHLLLARIYERGEATEVNHPLAREHCETAARANYAPALTQQALWYWDGTLYRRDRETAAKLFELAFQLGDNEAYYCEAKKLEQVFGETSPVFAAMGLGEPLHFYIQAAKRGHGPSRKELDRPWSAKTLDALRDRYPESAAELRRQQETR